MKKLTLMALMSLAMISSVQAALVDTTLCILDGAKSTRFVAMVSLMRTIPVMLSALKVENNGSIYARPFESPLFYQHPATNVAERLANAMSNGETAQTLYNKNPDVRKAETIRIWANRISAAVYAGIFGGAVASLCGKTLPTCVQKIFGSKLQSAILCAGSGAMLYATLPYLKTPYVLDNADEQVS